MEDCCFDLSFASLVSKGAAKGCSCVDLARRQWYIVSWRTGKVGKCYAKIVVFCVQKTLVSCKMHLIALGSSTYAHNPERLDLLVTGNNLAAFTPTCQAASTSAKPAA